MDTNPHHSFRVYNPEGQIEKLIYALHVDDGFMVMPYALTVSDPWIIQTFTFLIDDDYTPLIDDDGVQLIEDPF